MVDSPFRGSVAVFSFLLVITAGCGLVSPDDPLPTNLPGTQTESLAPTASVTASLEATGSPTPGPGGTPSPSPSPTMSPSPAALELAFRLVALGYSGIPDDGQLGCTDMRACCEELNLALVKTQAELEALYAAELLMVEVPEGIDFESEDSIVSYTTFCSNGG